ncbi:MAG TPA: GNAT family N-acetyltransferase [Caulobacteraceae bacterium]|nr:GNAT family N-acetyltransferase [Caulobacteraceae bacterium]
MNLITLTAERAPDMAALHALAFETPWDAPAISALLAGPGVFALAVEGGGRLEAFILMRAIAGEAEILTLATAPGFRRRGLARALLDAGLKLSAQAGAEKVFLEVAHDNRAAIDLYQDCDFRPTGRRPAYYARRSGPPADAIVLSRALDPTGA